MEISQLPPGDDRDRRGGAGQDKTTQRLIMFVKEGKFNSRHRHKHQSKIYIKINTIAAFGFIKMITEAIHTDLFQKASLPHNLDNIAM